MQDPSTTKRVAVLIGSVRENSNSARIGHLIAKALGAQGAVVDVVDPRALPLLVPHAPGSEASQMSLVEGIKARVSAADAVVLVTPEYDGSYSAVLKIMIEHLGYPSVLAGKPVGLLGVASGAIGALKALEHLRGICFHIGALVMPESKSFAAVHLLFDRDGHCIDAATMNACTDYARSVLSFATWIIGVGAASHARAP